MAIEMIPFSTIGEAWKLCDRLQCPESRPLFYPNDAVSLYFQLSASNYNSIRLTALRNILLRTGSAWGVSRMTDQQVINEIVQLFIAGRLHLHSTAPQLVRPVLSVGISEVSSAAPSRPPAQPSRPPQTSSSQSRLANSDAVTFTAPLNGAAQAAVLMAAAAQGQPFCPQ